MCGRYTLSTPADVIADLLAAEPGPTLEPRYNIAPTQESVIVRTDRDGRRRLAVARWGLVPFWAESLAIGNRLINARAESVDRRRAFAESFRGRRCLVPADGFYEWRRNSSGRRPYLFYPAKPGALFTFAGLWDRWRDKEDAVDSFTILTTAANDAVAPIHHRMPAIVGAEGHGLWLDPNAGSEDLRTLLRPIPAAEIGAHAVSSRVNRPQNDSPELIRPVADEVGETLSLFPN